MGATIGNITVSAPACADDIALLGESKDIQAMKAVFLKQTRIIIVSIYKYTVYIMF
jgi:hypothetical protein